MAHKTPNRASDLVQYRKIIKDIVKMIIIYTAMIDSPEELSKFELLYANYKNTMFSVAFDLTKNNHTAEDIVQISLIKLIDILYKIEYTDIKKQKCKNLLITITKNTAIDVIRKESKIIPFEAIDPADSPTMSSAEDCYFESSDYNDLIKCIDKLDDIYRDVLRLRMLHHLTAIETAKILNTKVCTINMRYKRAKAKLSNLVKENRNV